MSRQKLFLLLFVLTIGIFLYRIYVYRDNYTKPYDAKYWQYRYDHSQWIAPSDCKHIDPHINPETCAWDDAWYAAHKNDPFVKHEVISLGDDGLYGYVGWKLFTGTDPASINAEIPPFGKYLIGLSIFIFKNQNIYALLMGAGVLVAMYFLNSIIFKDKLMAIIPVFLFSLESLFFQQLAAPFLDLQMLLFLLLTFIFFLKKHYIISSVMLGLFTATKAPFLAVFVVMTCLGYLLITRQKKELKKYLLLLPLSFFIYLLCYSMYFVHGHSIKEFFSLQKWIVSFYSSGTKPPFYGMVFPMIATGTWYTWWGTVERVREWWVGWPIIGSFFVGNVIMVLKELKGLMVRSRKKTEKKLLFQHPILLLSLWVVLYVGFLIITPVWPRYLLLLLPFLYNLAIWVVLQSKLQKYLRL